MTWAQASVGQVYLFSLAVIQDGVSEAWLGSESTGHFPSGRSARGGS